MLLVMDYMEGGPVMTRDALERGRCIPEPLALQYFRDMCKVCSFTHHAPHGVCHIDYNCVSPVHQHMPLQSSHDHSVSCSVILRHGLNDGMPAKAKSAGPPSSGKYLHNARQRLTGCETK